MSSSVSSSSNRARIGHFEDRRDVANGKKEGEIDQENLVNDAAVTQKKLVAIAAEIEKAIVEADDNTAIRAAEKLYQQGLVYIRNSLGKNPENSIREEIPLQITLKTIKLLTKGEIQYCDPLKEELSTICALFAERVLWLARDQERSISQNVREDLLRDLAVVIYSTPKVEVATHFETKCCQAAVHKMISLRNRMLGVVKKNGLSVVKGALSAAVNLSGGPIVDPLVDTTVELFRQKSKLWYPEISQIRREFLKVTQLSDLRKKEVKDLLSKWNQSNKHTICFVHLFSRILRNPDFLSSSDLKDEIFEKTTPSLKTLAMDGYWKSRCLSIKGWLMAPQYRYRDIKTLESQLELEQDERVLGVFVKFCDENREWTQKFNSKILRACETRYTEKRQRRISQEQAGIASKLAKIRSISSKHTQGKRIKKEGGEGVDWDSEEEWKEQVLNLFQDDSSEEWMQSTSTIDEETLKEMLKIEAEILENEQI